LVPASAYKNISYYHFSLKKMKNICVFVLCNRNEGWSENNIPWWRGPRARTRARGHYYCLGSKRPLSIYKVRTLEVLCVPCLFASLVTTHLLPTGSTSR